MTGMAILQICGAVLLVALVQAQSDDCQSNETCISAEVKRVFQSQDRSAICRVLPGIIQCTERANSLCANEIIAAMHNDTVTHLTEALNGYCNLLP